MLIKFSVVKFSVENVVISGRWAGMDADDKVISYPIMVIMFLEVVLVVSRTYRKTIYRKTISIHVMCVTMFISVLG